MKVGTQRKEWTTECETYPKCQPKLMRIRAMDEKVVGILWNTEAKRTRRQALTKDLPLLRKLSWVRILPRPAVQRKLMALEGDSEAQMDRSTVRGNSLLLNHSKKDFTVTNPEESGHQSMESSTVAWIRADTKGILGRSFIDRDWEWFSFIIGW